MSFKQLKTIRILVVEDSPIAQLAVKSRLEHLNCTVEVVESGEKALEKTRENRYDLIYMDVGLPGIDGNETTRRIRALEASQQRKPTPIIALTAHMGDDGKALSLAVGMNEVARKPLASDQARVHINHYIPHKAADMGAIHWDEAIEKYGNREFVEKMLKGFMNEFDTKLDEIEKSYQAKDWETMAKHIHYIHGAMGYCGLLDLMAVTKTLEISLNRKDINGIESSYQQFKNEAKRLHREYKQFK